MSDSDPPQLTNPVKQPTTPRASEDDKEMQSVARDAIPQSTTPQAETASRAQNGSLAPGFGDEDRPLSYADLRRFGLLVLGLVTAAFVVKAVGDILLLFAIVFLAAAALNPVVVWLTERGLKRGLAVVLVMLGLLGILGGVGSLIVPSLIKQGNELVQSAPAFANNIQAQADNLAQRYPDLRDPIDRLKHLDLPNLIQQNAQDFGPTLATRAGGIIRGVVGGVFGFLVALLLLVFMLTNPQPMLAGLLRATPLRHRDAMGRTLARFLTQMGAWAKATLINGLITGVSTGLLLHLIGVQPALVFGLLAFFGEFVPNIGPVVAASPALFVALGMGPEKAGLTLLAILFVQQVESNVLVPFVMGSSLELHPVSIVFFALVMGALFNIPGAIMAVPTAVLVKIVWDEWVLRPRGELNTSGKPDEVEARAGKIVSGQFSVEDESQKS